MGERMNNEVLGKTWAKVIAAANVPRVPTEVGDAVDDLADEIDRARASEEAKDKEIAAIKADNAALLGAVNDVLNYVHCHSPDMGGNHRYSFMPKHGPAVARLQALAEREHPGADMLKELETLRAVKAKAEADSYAVHGVLGWAGAWSLGLPAPSRAVVALLEQLRKQEETVKALKDALSAMLQDVLESTP